MQNHPKTALQVGGRGGGGPGGHGGGEALCSLLDVRPRPHALVCPNWRQLHEDWARTTRTVAKGIGQQFAHPGAWLNWRSLVPFHWFPARLASCCGPFCSIPRLFRASQGAMAGLSARFPWMESDPGTAWNCRCGTACGRGRETGPSGQNAVLTDPERRSAHRGILWCFHAVPGQAA